MHAVALNCTLKASPEPSSTEALARVVTTTLEARGVTTDVVRLADSDIAPGVVSEPVREGDDWPAIRARILAADILVVATPTWLGQPSSVSKRALERMDAFLSETDENGRMPSYGKIAVLAIVGNEDGGHNVSAQLYQALNDTGWTIPAAAVSYWVGEAMGKTDFKDLPNIPEKVEQTAAMVASNAAHLAALLKERPYPGS